MNFIEWVIIICSLVVAIIGFVVILADCFFTTKLISIHTAYNRMVLGVLKRI